MGAPFPGGKEGEAERSDVPVHRTKCDGGSTLLVAQCWYHTAAQHEELAIEYLKSGLKVWLCLAKLTLSLKHIAIMEKKKNRHFELHINIFN